MSTRIANRTGGLPAVPDKDAPEANERRAFLSRSAAIAGAAISAGALAAGRSGAASAAEPAAALPVWTKTPGAPLRGYGMPSSFEEPVKRVVTSGYPTISPGTGSSLTPLQALEGTITPNGLHFERHHNGVPNIDPAQHRLVIHGLVRRPLSFSRQSLSRYPMISRTHFVECSGNSSRNTVAEPLQVTCGTIHGLLSNSEWTGVPLSILLEEAGVDPSAKWLLAEGADAAAMSRSVPIEKAMDDAMIALYQNGEHIRPEQGYPMRLLLPGWEGNMNVKWLRQLKLTTGPMHTKDETSKYTDLMPDGRAQQFTFPLGVKSTITRPSFGVTMQGAGLYEISGVAWSGSGRVARVEISLDGGVTWQDARLDGIVLPKAVVRFRMPWQWNGSPALLQSRATDDKGNVQPTRRTWTAQFSPAHRYHNNMIQTWQVNADGSVANVFV